MKKININTKEFQAKKMALRKELATKGIDGLFRFDARSFNDMDKDTGYQRETDKENFVNEVNKLMSKFKFKPFDPVVVSDRGDGVLHIVDGQHRAMAWSFIFGANTPMPVRIVECEREEEARLFVEQDDSVTRVKNCDKRKGKKLYDKSIEECENLCSKYGITVGGTASNYNINALQSVDKMYDELGATKMERVLRILLGSWSGNRKCLGREMLEGMTEFMKLYGDDVDDKALIRSFEKTSPEEIISKANKLTKNNTNTLGIRCAFIMFQTYNKRRSKSKLSNSIWNNYSFY